MKSLLVVSGGDAPGINAALHNYATLAHRNGDRVVGAMGSFEGILKDQIIPLIPDELALFAGQGGTVLVSSRAPVLKDRDNHQRCEALDCTHRDADDVRPQPANQSAQTHDSLRRATA